MWRKGTLVHCWWDCRLGQPLCKAVWRFLKKIINRTTSDPASGNISKENKDTHLKRYPHSHVHCGVAYGLQVTLETPQVPLGGWGACVRTMEYYSAMKRCSDGICDNMHSPRRYYAKGSKSLTCRIWKKKSKTSKQTNKPQKQTHGYSREWADGCQGERVGRWVKVD